MNEAEEFDIAEASDDGQLMSKERVATRVTVRTVKGGDSPTERYRTDMSADRFTWLNSSACAELTIGHFFVEAGHAISEDVLNVCRGCPVRLHCLDHAYEMSITGGYFGGMSPGQRRTMSLSEARTFVGSDPMRASR
jgi:hypothetical protein